MKILAIGLLILVMMGGVLNADDHSATNNKIALNLDGTSEVLVEGFIAPIEYTQYVFADVAFMWSGMNWQICGLLNPRSGIPHRFSMRSFHLQRFLLVISGRSKKRVYLPY